MSAEVKHVFLKVKHGQPMVANASVESVAGFGLRGDASFGRRSRQVLLMDLETLDEFGLAPGDVRENITTQGLNLSVLPPKSVLRVGPALLETSGECYPCSQLDDLREGLQQAISGRRGVLANFLEGGTISVGDRIVVESPTREGRAPTPLRAGN